MQNQEQQWQRWRNAIHTLYVMDQRPLQGREGVIQQMILNHGFEASKNQYERHLERWGFSKKRTRKDWQIISFKVNKRRRSNKETNLYIDDIIVPAKKLCKAISGQGYMTTVEHIQWAQELPLGMQIRTPSVVSVSQLTFEELPILKLHAIIGQNLGEIISIVTLQQTANLHLVTGLEVPDDPTLAAIQSIAVAATVGPTITVSEVLRGLVPDTLDSHIKRSLLRPELRNAHYCISLFMYLMSNKLINFSNTPELYYWLRSEFSRVSHILNHIRGPSTEAILETSFKAALEAEDLAVIDFLLQAGADPNATCHTSYEFFESLTPVQFACLRGNKPLIHLLLRHGALVDNAESGWSGSTLILAMVGFRRRGFATVANRNWYHQQSSQQRVIERDLTALIKVLVQAGANVNCNNQSSYNSKYHFKSLEIMAFSNGQSSLTVAAHCLYPEVVELLLESGSDVSSAIGTRSAIWQCLDSPECPSTYLGVDDYRPDYDIESRIIRITRALVKAGVEVNDHLACSADRQCQHSDRQCYSTLDLAIGIENMELFDLMTLAGASSTRHSFTNVVEVKNVGILRKLVEVQAVSLNSGNNNLQAATLPVLPQVTRFHHHGNLVICSLCLGDMKTLHHLIQVAENSSTELIDSSDNQCWELLQRRTFIQKQGLQMMIRSQLPLGPFVKRFFIVALTWAIINNDETLANCVLRRDITFNSIPNAEKPLLLAIERQDIALIQRLIHAGAKLRHSPGANICSYNLGNVLVPAIATKNHAVIREIISSNADINAAARIPWEYSRDNYTFCCSCCSPLTMAILTRNWTLVDELRLKGARLNHTSHTSAVPFRTPLWAALKMKNPMLAQSLLLDGAHPDDCAAMAMVSDEQSALMYLQHITKVACRHPRSQGLSYLLLTRSQLKLEQIIGLILRIGLIRIDSAMLIDSRLKMAARQTPEALRLVLSSKTDPTATVRCDHMNSPMALAIKAGRSIDLEVLDYLYESGANIDGSLYEYECPLQIATKYYDERAVRWLLQKGADPNVCRSSQIPALHTATKRKLPGIVRLLLEHGAVPDLVPMNDSDTPLQCSCSSGTKDIVSLLIEYGANVNAAPGKKDGATALQYAVIYGHFGIADLLIKKGADVNAPPAEGDGRTALEGAAEHGRIDLIQFLVNAGADLSEANGQYERALERALKNGHMATRRLLMSYLS